LSPLPLPARAAPRQLHSFPTRRSSDLALQSRCKALHIASPLPYLSIGVVEADYRHRGSPALSKVVTVHDVAAKANVSTASVSRRSEEHTSELQSRFDIVCRRLLEKQPP